MGDGASGGTSKSTLEMAALLLAPAGVVTGMLYFFGYAREQAFFAYFGVDLSSVGYTTSDYLVRSAGPVFVLVGWLLLATLIAVILHHLVSYAMLRTSARRRLMVLSALGALAVAFLAFGVSGLLRPSDPLIDPVAAPVALAMGTLLVDYLAQAPRLGGRAPPPIADALTSTRPLRRGLSVALILLAAFWCLDIVAVQHGKGAARAFEMSLLVRPKAIVYSHDRLQVTGLGVTTTRLDASQAAYAFRYDGLRVVSHTGRWWYLVPVGWLRGNGQPIILLPDTSTTLRIDVSP
jgi:hypothetical protein